MRTDIFSKGMAIGIIMLFIGTSVGLNIKVGKGTTTKIDTFQNSSSVIRGECDLYFVTATYGPNRPESMGEFTIYLKVDDKLGNYNDSYVNIHLESDIPLNRTYRVPFGISSFNFVWPDDNSKTHYIKLTIIPTEIANWNETNWADNTKIYDGLTPDIALWINQIPYDSSIKFPLYKNESYGGDCDLYIYDVTFSPNPPLYNHYLVIYLTASDKLGNYPNYPILIHVVSDLPKDGNWTVVCDEPNFGISIRWPLSIKSYNITLTATPFEPAGWTETNWSDNTYTINNISAGTIPTSLLGSINNVTKSDDFISFNAKSVICVSKPFNIEFIKNNNIITIPKNTLGLVGNQFVIGFFK